EVFETAVGTGRAVALEIILDLIKFFLGQIARAHARLFRLRDIRRWRRPPSGLRTPRSAGRTRRRARPSSPPPRLRRGGTRRGRLGFGNGSGRSLDSAPIRGFPALRRSG